MNHLARVYSWRHSTRPPRGGTMRHRRQIAIKPTRAIAALHDLLLGPLVRVGEARWRGEHGSGRTYYTATINKLVAMGLAEIVGDRVMEPMHKKPVPR